MIFMNILQNENILFLKYYIEGEKISKDFMK